MPREIQSWQDAHMLGLPIMIQKVSQFKKDTTAKRLPLLTIIGTSIRLVQINGVYLTPAVNGISKKLAAKVLALMLSISTFEGVGMFLEFTLTKIANQLDT
jgi:hypothetical protein